MTDTDDLLNEATRLAADYRNLDGDHSGHTYDVANSMQDVLKVLATIYADHPDYDESWRP